MERGKLNRLISGRPLARVTIETQTPNGVRVYASQKYHGEEVREAVEAETGIDWLTPLEGEKLSDGNWYWILRK